MVGTHQHRGSGEVGAGGQQPAVASAPEAAHPQHGGRSARGQRARRGAPGRAGDQCAGQGSGTGGADGGVVGEQFDQQPNGVRARWRCGRTAETRHAPR